MSDIPGLSRSIQRIRALNEQIARLTAAKDAERDLAIKLMQGANAKQAVVDDIPVTLGESSSRKFDYDKFKSNLMKIAHLAPSQVRDCEEGCLKVSTHPVLSVAPRGKK